MRLLGVFPGVLHYSKFFLRLEPIGLELVAQAARQAGHQVKLIDLQVEDHRAYFRTLESWWPDVIAFSCNYLPHVPEIIDLAKATKTRFPEMFICVGGHSAIIEHGAGAIDSVLKGEGEAGMPLLLAAIEGGRDPEWSGAARSRPSSRRRDAISPSVWRSASGKPPAASAPW